jgi:hypothetical protein
MRLAFVLVCLASGCHALPSAFTCTLPNQCQWAGDAGVCEPTGFCSVVDSSCATGRSYLGAGMLDHQCVDPKAAFGSNTGDSGKSELTRLHQADGTDNHNFSTGVDAEVFAWAPNDVGTALLRFDGITDKIPSNATVASVALRLYLVVDQDSAPGYTVELFHCKQPWVETEATWNQWKNGSAWLSGGGLGATDRNLDHSASLVIGDAAIGQYMTWTSTPELVADVQSVVGNRDNNGWVLERTDGVTQTTRWFATENGADGQRPELIVTYKLPQ